MSIRLKAKQPRYNWNEKLFVPPKRELSLVFVSSDIPQLYDLRIYAVCQI